MLLHRRLDTWATVILAFWEITSPFQTYNVKTANNCQLADYKIADEMYIVLPGCSLCSLINTFFCRATIGQKVHRVGKQQCLNGNMIRC